MIYMPSTTANLKEMVTQEDSVLAAFMKRVWQARIFGQKASMLPAKMRTKAINGQVRLDVAEAPEPTAEDVAKFREELKKMGEK